MYPIKQSTAITVPFFVHDVNGDAVTGLTNASFTKRISKNGGAFAAMTVTITEMENGWYSLPLSASHTDTLGLLTVVFTNAGSQQVNLQWRVESRLVGELNNIAATDIVSAGPITTLAGAVVNVDTVDVCTTNSDMRGTDGANTVAPDNASIAAILLDTIELTANQSNWLTATDVNVSSISPAAITAASIAANALNDKGNWNIGKTGYSVINEVTANVVKINGVTVIGTGIAADKWRA